MKDGFYVLVEAAGKPAFLVDYDGDPMKFQSEHEARQLADQQSLARAYGYVVMAWPDGWPEMAKIAGSGSPVGEEG
jgi:hypothetical protein